MARIYNRIERRRRISAISMDNSVKDKGAADATPLANIRNYFSLIKQVPNVPARSKVMITPITVM